MLKFADFRGTPVRFSDEGEGRAVVFIHGFPESLKIWEEVSKKLSKSYRVIAMDLPGFGETHCLGYVHSMEIMADLVKSVMDTLGLRRYAVVGHSMGGYVALALARKYAGNICGLCLFHSSASADSEEKKADRDRAIEAVKKDKKAFVFQLLEKLFAEETLPLMKERLAGLKEIAASASAQSIIAALEGMKNRKESTDVISDAAYPVLYIIGKKDKVLPWEVLKKQAMLAKKGRSVLLENSGHMGFYEAPETVLKELKRFLRESFK